jgi:hypothetical protein
LKVKCSALDVECCHQLFAAEFSKANGRVECGRHKHVHLHNACATIANLISKLAYRGAITMRLRTLSGENALEGMNELCVPIRFVNKATKPRMDTNEHEFETPAAGLSRLDSCSFVSIRG